MAKVLTRPDRRNLGIHETGNGHQREARSQDEPGIDVLQQVDGEQPEHALRQGNPQQDRTCLQWTIALNRAKIAGDGNHRRQHHETKEEENYAQQKGVPPGRET